MTDQALLTNFLAESNLIEGIERPPTAAEVNATRAFLTVNQPTIRNLEHLVGVYAPGHVLRDHVGLNVRVGTYLAPPGGPEIATRLASLLSDISEGRTTPWAGHVAYELLHAFTDGNGRSGRALWLWHMLKIGRNPFHLPFLHRFYYQTLEAAQF